MLHVVPSSELRAIFYSGTIEENWLGHIMAEVYKDKIYQPYIPLNKKGTVAVDIGANIGLVSLYLSSYFERVIAVEPSSLHYEPLLRNLEANKATNVTPVKKAIYIREGKFPFGGPKGNLTMRSLHVATWQGGKSDEQIEAITLDRLFEDQKIERCHLMKFDIEGSESEVFASYGFQKVAPKIDIIVGERHHWSGRHPNQLDEALKKAGFEVSTIPNQADIFCARRVK